MPETDGLPISVLRCAVCGALDPGPRLLCPRCHGRDVRAHDVAGEGRLVSWTLIRRPPHGFAEEGPVAVAIVDLDAKVRVTGRLRNVTVEPKLGERVVCRGMQGGAPVFERAGS